jgi:cellulose synthase/poly-beta-1,6-N-acetylglucosamine synthase-like glycosyltransferase
MAIQSQSHAPAKVAVVIPTYNSAQYLARALASVEAQTYRDFQLFVVDDGSTDNTEEIVAKFACVFDKQQHAGQAAARNRGIALSSSPYVAFLDADDAWMPQKLKQQIAFLESHLEVGLVCCDCADGGSEPMARPARSVPQDPQFEHLARDCFIFTPTVVVRRECLKEWGGFNESLKVSEDLNLWLKIASRWKVVFVPKKLAVRYSRAGSLSLTTRPEEACAQGIAALEDVIRSCPQLSPTQLRAVNRELAVRYYNYGSFLLSSGQARESRPNLLAAGRHRRGNWRAFAKFVASFLPTSLRNSLVTLHRTARGTLKVLRPKSYSRFTDT